MDYKWRALAVVTLGSLMTAVDGTVVVIAFPQIALALRANLASMVWAIMIYILMGTALVLSLGRLADLTGRRRLYLTGFGVFVLGSALCGLSSTGLELVAFRGVQGVGGAMIIANTFALLSDAFPPGERGVAFGVNSVVWAIGSIGGIVLGGFILSVADWRWIFWINLPIGAGTILLAARTLRESRGPRTRETFDFPAAALLTSGLAALLLGVTDGIISGWRAPETVLPLLLTGPLLALFIVWELRFSRDPIVPLEMFGRWIFSASLLASLLQGIAALSANFLLMVYFQGIRGVPVLTAAYLLAPLPICMAVVGPIGGRLADLYGARVVSTAGLLVQALVFVGFATVGPSTSLYQVAAYEAAFGVGSGLFFPANNSATLGEVPRARLGVATGVMMTVRNSANALSFAVVLVVLSSQLPAQLASALFGGAFDPAGLAGAAGAGNLETEFLGGFHLAFAASAALAVGAAGFSVVRGREARTMAYPPHRRSVRPVHHVYAGEAPAYPVGLE